MANGDSTPTPPPAPKKRLGEPARAEDKGDTDYADFARSKTEKPRVLATERDYDKPREGFLAMGTRGPITNEQDVTRQVQQSINKDQAQAGREQARVEARHYRRAGKLRQLRAGKR